jgi:ethanolamine ammonia-lyase small subunit
VSISGVRAAHDDDEVAEVARLTGARPIASAAVRRTPTRSGYRTSETRADADDYVAGRIDSDELVERARARYGLS